MKNIYLIGGLTAALALGSCKKEGCTDPNALNYDEKAKKENNTCTFPEETGYTVPTTYNFLNSAAVSTVSFSGQTTRIDQLTSIMEYVATMSSTSVSAQQLKEMFSNETSYFAGTTKNLKSKCFSLDVDLYETMMDSIETLSNNNTVTASNGVAGKLTSGTSTYFFTADGKEPKQLLEKGLMGAVFMDQALNGYFSDTKMNVDNTTIVEGKTYTAMEHHWDEAFGYFGVDVTFPTIVPTMYWGKYCNKQDATLGANNLIMGNFLKGRAAISNNEIADRDAAILAIRNAWEDVTAHQGMTYIDEAKEYLFGTTADQAKGLHALSEAYAFIWNIRYATEETRNISQTELTAIIAMFGDNFWELTLQDLNNIKAAIDAKY